MWFSHIFRRKPQPVSDTATDDAPENARPRDFSRRTTAPWDRTLPSGAWDRMRRGYQPESMDDRWVVSMMGEGRLVFARSWTMTPIVEVQAAAGVEARIVAVAWEGDGSEWVDGSEEKAKELVGQLCWSLFEIRLSPADD